MNKKIILGFFAIFAIACSQEKLTKNPELRIDYKKIELDKRLGCYFSY